MITDELLDRISELAQLEIADDEREAVKADLESVIDMVEKFKTYCKVNKINFESFNSKITKINQLKQKVNKLIYSNNISDF